MAQRFLCCEGDMDRVVFERVLSASPYQILPDKPKPCTARARAGAVEASARALELVQQNVPAVVLAMDIDTRSPDELFLSIEERMRSRGISFQGGAGIYDVQGSSLRVVPVGVPGDPALAEFGIASHAIDDYLVVLLQNQTAYDGVVSSNSRPAPAHNESRSIVRGACEDVRRRWPHFASSKQVLAIYRAILQFPASLAAFAESILSHAPEEVRHSALSPLNDALA